MSDYEDEAKIQPESTQETMIVINTYYFLLL